MLTNPLRTSTSPTDIDGSNEEPLTQVNAAGPNYSLSLQKHQGSPPNQGNGLTTWPWHGGDVGRSWEDTCEEKLRSPVSKGALVVSPSLEGLHDGRHAKHSTGVTACQMICLDSITLVINQVVVGWLVR